MSTCVRFEGTLNANNFGHSGKTSTLLRLDAMELILISTRATNVTIETESTLSAVVVVANNLRLYTLSLHLMFFPQGVSCLFLCLLRCARALSFVLSRVETFSLDMSVDSIRNIPHTKKQAFRWPFAYSRPTCRHVGHIKRFAQPRPQQPTQAHHTTHVHQ